MKWPTDERGTMDGPLSGVRVLDLSRIIAGPLSSLYLADLGADVIKIERPEGDEMRGYGPQKWQGTGTTFLALNRNKRSVVLNLNEDEDRDALRALVAEADVLIESYRPGIMQRWGLGYEELRRINPRIIHCSITGFGSRGPAAGLGANNLIAEGFGGSLSVAVDVSKEKMRTGTPMTDYFTGTSAALAITAALMQRERSGEGTHIETSLFESQTMMMSGYLLGYLATGINPSPEDGLPFTVPNQAFQAADGSIVLAVNSEAMWARMCEALERRDWLENPDYATNRQRMERQREIVDQLAEIIGARPRSYWIELFGAHRVTIGPINTVADVIAHPQSRELGILLPIEDPEIGGLRTVRPPFSFSTYDWSDGNHRPPPRLGEHDDVIRED